MPRRGPCRFRPPNLPATHTVSLRTKALRPRQPRARLPWQRYPAPRCPSPAGGTEPESPALGRRSSRETIRHVCSYEWHRTRIAERHRGPPRSITAPRSSGRKSANSREDTGYRRCLPCGRADGAYTPHTGGSALRAGLGIARSLRGIAPQCPSVPTRRCHAGRGGGTQSRATRAKRKGMIGIRPARPSPVFFGAAILRSARCAIIPYTPYMLRS
jgi:hypothetical protein